MRSFKYGNHTVLTLSVVMLLIMISYAYGAATMSSSSSTSALSSSSSLISTEQRKLSEQENGDFDITPHKKGDGAKRKGGSKGNKRKGGSKRNGVSKKSKTGGGKKSRQSTLPNFITSCECGKEFTNRIIGGVPATKNEYPWQVALYIGTTFQCGGTLINDRFVLTAAHCIDSAVAADVTVRLREHNINKPDQPKEIEKSIANLIIHKDYVSDGQTPKNDIALLEFNEMIVFPKSRTLRPICLPSTTSELYVGDNAVATGWGRTAPIPVPLSDVLMEVELTVVAENVCKGFYDPGEIDRTQICAGNKAANTCFGDSGGPLAYKNSMSRYEQIGITSFGDAYCNIQNQKPAVFTRVNKYLRWIKKKTKSAIYCKGFTFP